MLLNIQPGPASSLSLDDFLFPVLAILIILAALALFLAVDWFTVRWNGFGERKAFCTHPKPSRHFLYTSVGMFGSEFEHQECLACGSNIKTRNGRVVSKD